MRHNLFLFKFKDALVNTTAYFKILVHNCLVSKFEIHSASIHPASLLYYIENLLSRVEYLVKELGVDQGVVFC